ncbi:MAG: hypothetical protein ABS46_00760 [Cytophagaceae bacterium SCN 52-12]|nr:MAG: hypothetical protein ABS46_00760 [Cytophagaceae bacterium SCN 52-12]
MNIGCFGSSLLSAYWNGAATYYRGIFKELARLGHSVTFFEPDAYGRQAHKDIEAVEGVTSIVYEPEEDTVRQLVPRLEEFDILIKCSGIGALDEFLEMLFPMIARKGQLLVFWDVDAPATLSGLKNNPGSAVHQMIARCDLVLTYGGGERVVAGYKSLGAADCIPVYNAADPETHYPEVDPGNPKSCDLLFIGNRLPDREQRVMHFFEEAAKLLSRRRFVIGGSGWDTHQFPPNVIRLGHVYTREHNLLNGSTLAVLNISRQDMAESGYSPATRVFEAAAAGACIITDEWDGIPFFFEPDEEILVARDGLDVAVILSDLTPEKARGIGEAARARVLKDHCYSHRALQVEQLFKHHFFQTTDS